ncbi:hypothetical protein ACFLTZ_02905 [Chloroflexota bacterium]
MDHEFTVDEIRDAARMARVYCPGFSEEKFQSLIDLEKRIGDSGYLEAVLGLIRLEEEMGLSYSEALDACEELSAKKSSLGRKVSELEKWVESLVTQIRQANGKYEQVEKSTTKAGQELAQIRSEYAAAEKKLETINKKTEKEKQRFNKEIEKCHREANITREEVVTAGKIKAEVEGYGFTVELMLDLSKEFAGHKNARKELGEALKERGSLNKYLASLADWANKERTRLMAEIGSLESQKMSLSNESVRLRNIISQLQADITSEEELRRFYHRYAGVSGLMEHLASWNKVFFVRCDNPLYELTGAFDANSGNARFWTDKPPAICPQCRYGHLIYDEAVYQALNWPAGEPVKLVLGE